MGTKQEATGVTYVLNEQVIDSCNDGSDNDCDGYVDSMDSGCWGTSVSLQSVCSEGGFTAYDDIQAVVTYEGLTNDVQIEYDWRINGESIAMVNYNFDVPNNPGSGQTYDYSTNPEYGTVSGALYQNQGDSTVSSGGYGFGSGRGITAKDHTDNIIKSGDKFGTYDGDFAYELWIRPFETIMESASKLMVQFNPNTCSGQYAGTNGAQEYAIYPDMLPVGTVGCPSSITELEVGVGLSIGNDGLAVVEHGGGYMPATLLFTENWGTGWKHIIVNYENGVPSLYVDGVLKKTGVRGKHKPVPSRRIGGEAQDYGFFDGRINSFRIYNRALTEAQIQYLKNPASSETRNYLSSAELNPGDTVQVCVTINNRTTELESVCSGTVTISSGGSACQTCPPESATNLVATQESPSTLKLSWTPASGINKQMVSFGTDQIKVNQGCPNEGDCIYDNDNEAASTNSVVLNGLNAGTTYYYKIASVQESCGATDFYSNVYGSFTMCSGCFISDVCYENGALRNGYYGCQYCNKALSESSWSYRSYGYSCDRDGQYCTSDYCNYYGQCNAGGDPCSLGVCNEELDKCDECAGPGYDYQCDRAGDCYYMYDYYYNKYLKWETNTGYCSTSNECVYTSDTTCWRSFDTDSTNPPGGQSAWCLDASGCTTGVSCNTYGSDCPFDPAPGHCTMSRCDWEGGVCKGVCWGTAQNNDYERTDCGYYMCDSGSGAGTPFCDTGDESTKCPGGTYTHHQPVG